MAPKADRAITAPTKEVKRDQHSAIQILLLRHSSVLPKRSFLTWGQILAHQFQSYSAINMVTVIAAVITAVIALKIPNGALSHSLPVVESASSAGISFLKAWNCAI